MYKIPGMLGLNPELLQPPQPLSRPGQWEAEIDRHFSVEHCYSTEPVIQMHEQVNWFDKMYKVKSKVMQDYARVTPVPKFYSAWSKVSSAPLVSY